MTAFASAIEVATRLGTTLSDADTASATMLTELTTGLIAEAASKDDAWAAALDPVPTALRALCIEVTCRAMANPGQLQALTENVGSYSYTQNFRTGLDNGLMLTDAETALARRIVDALDGYTTSGSAEVESIVDDLPIVSWPLGWPVELTDLGEDDPVYYMPSDD